MGMSRLIGRATSKCSFEKILFACVRSALANNADFPVADSFMNHSSTDRDSLPTCWWNLCTAIYCTFTSDPEACSCFSPTVYAYLSGTVLLACHIGHGRWIRLASFGSLQRSYLNHTRGVVGDNTPWSRCGKGAPCTSNCAGHLPLTSLACPFHFLEKREKIPARRKSFIDQC